MCGLAHRHAVHLLELLHQFLHRRQSVAVRAHFSDNHGHVFIWQAVGERFEVCRQDVLQGCVCQQLFLQRCSSRCELLQDLRLLCPRILGVPGHKVSKGTRSSEEAGATSLELAELLHHNRQTILWVGVGMGEAPTSWVDIRSLRIRLVGSSNLWGVCFRLSLGCLVPLAPSWPAWVNHP